MYISRYIALAFILLVCFVLPPVFLAFSKKNTGQEVWTAAFFGAIGFVVTQLLIRIPILSTVYVVQFLSSLPPLFRYFALALTAGLFETTGRLLVFLIPLNRRSSYEDGLSAGIGHGWVEAAILVGLNNIFNLLTLILYQAGGAVLVAKYLPFSEIEAANLALVLQNTPTSLFWASGFERLFAIIAHTAFSLLLFYFIRNKSALSGFFIVVGLHTVLDFVSILISAYVGILATEIFIAAFGVGCLVFCIKAKPLFKSSYRWAEWR